MHNAAAMHMCSKQNGGYSYLWCCKFSYLFYWAIYGTDTLARQAPVHEDDQHGIDPPRQAVQDDQDEIGSPRRAPVHEDNQHGIGFPRQAPVQDDQDKIDSARQVPVHEDDQDGIGSLRQAPVHEDDQTASPKYFCGENQRGQITPNPTERQKNADKPQINNSKYSYLLLASYIAIDFHRKSHGLYSSAACG